MEALTASSVTCSSGNLVTELGHTIFTESEGLLGSREHGGFLYVRPTFQCLRNLVLPPSPYIFAVLIQKWETPWAKVREEELNMFIKVTRICLY